MMIVDFNNVAALEGSGRKNAWDVCRTKGERIIESELRETVSHDVTPCQVFSPV
jgi:hypothetical protein